MAKSFILDPLDSLDFLPPEEKPKVPWHKPKDEYPIVKGLRSFIADAPGVKILTGRGDEVAKDLSDWAKQGQEKFESRVTRKNGKIVGLAAPEVTEEDIGQALDLSNPMAKAGQMLAGVVKPKGGEWLGLQNVKEKFSGGGLGVDYPQWILKSSMPGIREFQDRYGTAYDKKLEAWVKNFMGTAEDPLKDVRIGKTPYTFGDLGDAMVHKADPEGLDIGAARVRKRDPETNAPIYDPESGEPIYESVPRVEYYHGRTGVHARSENIPERYAEKLRAWKMGEIPMDLYVPVETQTAVGQVAKIPRETPRDIYAERNPTWKEGQPRKWIPGKDVMGPLPEWKPEDPHAGGDYVRQRASVLENELRNTLADIGEHGGSYYQEELAKARQKNPNALEFTESFPDLIKKWPKAFQIADEADIAKNSAGVEKISDLGGNYVLVQMKTSPSVQREGRMMRHCIGQACNEVERGHVNAYSIRRADNMAPVVTFMTDLEKPENLLRERMHAADLIEILRDPERAIGNWMGHDAGQRYRQAYPEVADVGGDLDIIANLQRFNEVMDNPDAYARYLERNPEIRERVENVRVRAGQDDGGYAREPRAADVLEAALTPEQYDRVAPLLEERMPTFEKFRELKGRANTPVADQYQEALGAALREFSQRGVQPGRLAESEAVYARRIPVEDFASGNVEYLPIDDVRDEAIALLKELKKIPMNERPSVGINRSSIENSDPAQMVKNWDLETLQGVYKRLREAMFNQL